MPARNDPFTTDPTAMSDDAAPYDEPADISEWVAHARAHFEHGSLREALAALESAFLIDATNVGALALAAEVERAVGNDDLAESFLYLSENPDDVDELFELGYVFIDMEVYTLAAAFLSSANDLDPEHREVTYELAWALMKIGAFEEAIPFFERSLETDPDYRTLDCLATAYALLGNAPQAQEHLDAARALCDAQLGNADDGERVILDDTDALIARLRLADPGDEAGLREWHWILTGGAILHLPSSSPEHGSANGRAHHCVLTPSVLARVVRSLETLLKCQEFTPNVIEYLDGDAEFPARILAERLGATVRGPLGGRRRGAGAADSAVRFISVASSTDAIAPLADAFDEFMPGEILLVLTHDWTRTHAICPDIIGVMTITHATPWTATAMRRDGVTIRAAVPYREQLEKELELADDEETAITQLYADRPLALTRDVPGRRPEFRVESPVASTPTYPDEHDS